MISWLTKIIPIIILIIALANTPSFSGKTLLLLALAFSATGDVLLEQEQFLPGVGAFLTAQLHYGVFFARYWSSLKARWPISGFILIFMLVMAFLLGPHLGELKLPVFAYLMVIGFMGLLATQSNMPLKWSVLGAFVFILSDSFIAVDRFLQPLPLDDYLVMTSYYGAQWMIIQGALNKFKLEGI
ncbi:MAG: putative membrane protein YhhN [Alphaproteobacteria bacterium]|jgi:uncharacterized membrane protein YhhN